MSDTFRVTWADPWHDRPAKSRIRIDHMENGIVLRQFIMTREQAEKLADDILLFVNEPL